MSTKPELIDGGELIARTLQRAGVRRIHALHGGHLESFYRGCRNHNIELMDFRHEASAGHAADGHARTTGELGVCVVTAGPGYLNMLSAAVNAQLEGSPTLFIVGAPPLREDETSPLQGGFDQVAMALSCLKWAHRITHTERIPDLLAMAIRKATTGRCGAVLVEVPIDVLHISVNVAEVTSPSGLAVRPRPAPSASEIKAAIEILHKAKRPVVICGSESRFAQCQSDLESFARLCGIPVVSNARAFGMLPFDHPLNGGEAGNLAMLGALGRPRPDAVLLLGAKMGMSLGGRGAAILPDDAAVIQVSADPSEIGRIRDVAVPIAADCGSAVAALLQAAREVSWPDRGDWVQEIVALKHNHARMHGDVAVHCGIHPYQASVAVVEAAGPEAIYVLDGGETGQWAAHAVRVNGPGQFSTTGYLGLLGAGMGLAIGAQMARPDRRVVQIAGDGAVGFHLQELDTMMRHRLPIVTVVMNNRMWGMSLHGQQLLYGRDYEAISRLSDETSYARIAEGFGCYAETVTRLEDVGAAVTRALGTHRPACIDVRTDPDVVHPRMHAMLKPSETGEVVIPYYESIPKRTV
ncbi:MAG: thiamine pyrophosphate-binding protein [Devosia sp.]